MLKSFVISVEISMSIPKHIEVIISAQITVRSDIESGVREMVINWHDDEQFTVSEVISPPTALVISI